MKGVLQCEYAWKQAEVEISMQGVYCERLMGVAPV